MRIRTVLVMSIDHAMTVARLAADYGVFLTEIGDAMRRLDGPMRNRTVWRSGAGYSRRACW